MKYPWFKSSKTLRARNFYFLIRLLKYNLLFLLIFWNFILFVLKSSTQFAPPFVKEKDFHCGSDGKVSAYNAGDPGSVPESGRSSGEGNGNSLQSLAWKIPWSKEHSRLQSMGSQRVGHDLWKRWEYQTTWPASWETCIQVRKQQLELDMEQQTGSK